MSCFAVLEAAIFVCIRLVFYLHEIPITPEHFYPLSSNKNLKKKFDMFKQNKELECIKSRFCLFL